MSKRNILLNETGQMAVFIALIFQVLFVLFAMVINIGLIVHDKINLQNSVDLAAYYAASKQAESMNMIAHINYQMRQDYKLLAWRYRVLGSFGSDQPFHPAITQGNRLLDVEHTSRDEASVCLAHIGWNDSYSEDETANQCKTNTMTIPRLNAVPYIPLSAGINAAVAAQFDQARNRIRGNCEKVSPYNWGLATMMTGSFRLSIAERKKQIQKIASEMTKAENFLDVEGKSVREGALKTFEKNLTASNRDQASFIRGDESSFQLINGLAQGGCEQLDELGIPAWLVDIEISPIVRYTELTLQGSGANECRAVTKSYADPPAANTLREVDPTGRLREGAAEPSGKSFLRSSRGFEKNPWCLAYIGVKAKTKPRKPFAPFGEPITMEAKSIAEPFGGRIGPWYGKRWPSQASRSEASDPVDPLAVPRGDFDRQYESLYLPNYSRFPGDTLGLKSKLSLGLLRRAFYAAFNSRDSATKFNFSDYQNLMKDFATSGDPLAWSISNRPAPSRTLEVAAIMPDLFDIAYYSIDPMYYKDFYERAQGLFQGLAPVSDLGSRAGNDQLRAFSIKEQYNAIKDYPDSADAYFLTKQWEHVLTGWLQGGVVEYTSRAPAVAERFGACRESPTGRQPNVPGSCINGGRVGYSVRLVHKEYLFGEHTLGGTGSGADRIKNPPPSDF